MSPSISSSPYSLYSSAQTLDAASEIKALQNMPVRVIYMDAQGWPSHPSRLFGHIGIEVGQQVFHVWRGKGLLNKAWAEVKKDMQGKNELNSYSKRGYYVYQIQLSLLEKLKLLKALSQKVEPYSFLKHHMCSDYVMDLLKASCHLAAQQKAHLSLNWLSPLEVIESLQASGRVLKTEEYHPAQQEGHKAFKGLA